jgi:hypothetical protein
MLSTLKDKNFNGLCQSKIFLKFGLLSFLQTSLMDGKNVFSQHSTLMEGMREGLGNFEGFPGPLD